MMNDKEPQQVAASADDRVALGGAVARVLRDVKNFPPAVRLQLLRQDMTPLRIAIEESVLAAGFSRAATTSATRPGTLNIQKLFTVIGVALDSTSADANGEIEASIRREVTHWLESGDDTELPSSYLDEDSCWHEAGCKCIRSDIAENHSVLQHERFREKHGMFPSQSDSRFIANQRWAYRKGKLGPERTAILNEQLPGWESENRPRSGWQTGGRKPGHERFLERVEETRAFRIDHGRFPRYPDSQFIFTQRRAHRAGTLSPERIAILDERLPGWQGTRRLSNGSDREQEV